ncbi:hypothetical protein DICVIV_02263 [Dictyocaulus viviparus]|uniref:Uncharacterized protein n=1 Tax=Dictyocaulus viviparus TaxID=29172 RepID=A0A0D8YAB5_DICVI|nr:hypothetical protein DICVIV_02263 [Dictyocaulus viviparus]
MSFNTSREVVAPLERPFTIEEYFPSPFKRAWYKFYKMAGKNERPRGHSGATGPTGLVKRTKNTKR